MRRKILQGLHLLTIIMLVLTLWTGAYQTVQDFRNYGESYEVTTIIGETSVTRTIDMSSQVAGLMFVAWIIMLLTALLIMPNMPDKKEATEPRV